ncbi:MAG TPA: hypothetical protein VJ654_02830 [Noviherbaspirillum sp.]|nr:hypothetical protein [Noviherbaspirillum sp.]
MNFMKTNTPLQKMRIITGAALIGSVVAGVCFGWVEMSFDPRAIGATLGAVAGAFQAFHFA